MNHHDPAACGAPAYALAYLRYRAKLCETPPSAETFGITPDEGVRERTCMDRAITAIKDETIAEMHRAAVVRAV